MRIVHRNDGEYAGQWGITRIEDYKVIRAGLMDGRIDVVGATAWCWARPDFEQSVDVLIVDEAGQMSLANVLATAPAARSLVLLGDPQQLEQPLQSSHPEGSEVSALYHLLDGEQTMPPQKGLFLADTYRLHPEIARFTSEVYYEGRVQARPGLERQAILADGAPTVAAAATQLALGFDDNATLNWEGCSVPVFAMFRSSTRGIARERRRRSSQSEISSSSSPAAAAGATRTVRSSR